ncbi:hypothetical protein BCO26_1263 [Heyndrickxia coagulans 2-6]|nr:hypothetical protein BCO26_1263 [Heyndrickxia coagulans 2-6]
MGSALRAYRFAFIVSINRSSFPRFSDTYRATQRRPFPHIDASEPSALNTRIFASACWLSDTKSRPSAPSPASRRQNDRAIFLRISSVNGAEISASSISKKSFPEPWHLISFTCMMDFLSFSFFILTKIVSSLLFFYTKYLSCL